MIKLERPAVQLCVIVGKTDSLPCDPINIGSAVAHDTVAVCTDIGNPDIVTPYHQNIGFVRGLSRKLQRGKDRKKYA